MYNFDDRITCASQTGDGWYWPFAPITSPHPVGRAYSNCGHGKSPCYVLGYSVTFGAGDRLATVIDYRWSEWDAIARLRDDVRILP